MTISTEQYLTNVVDMMNSIDKFVMDDLGLVVYYKDLPNEPFSAAEYKEGSFMKEFLLLVEKHITV
jgi:hypothetical protein